MKILSCGHLNYGPLIWLKVTSLASTASVLRDDKIPLKFQESLHKSFSLKTSKYSHLFNKRGAWNKRGGGAKVAKLLNVELGINVEGGIFGKN